MKLSELYLDRYLYRDYGQDSETKGSEFESLNDSDPIGDSVPAGGAAQDINTGGVPIDGQVIEPGSIPTATLNVSNWGWGQTCVFAPDGADEVDWGAGTFTSANGLSYSISAGTTGAMSAKTYIYLDLNESETEYQITTDPSEAVGIGKVLIGVAEDGDTDATYALSEATQIVGDNILANTIDASKMNVGQLSAISANIGNITAGTITGVTIQTAVTGKRVVMSDNKIVIYNASGTVVGTFEGLTGTYASGIRANVGQIDVLAMTSTAFGFTAIATEGLIGVNTGDLYLSTRTSAGTGGNVLLVPEVSGDVVAYSDVRPNVTNGSLWLGDSTNYWGRLYLGTSNKYIYDNGGTLYYNGSAVGNSGTVTSIATSGAITGGTITTSGTISHSTAAGYKHIPSGGSFSQYLKYSSDGTASWQYLSGSNCGSLIPSASAVTLGNSTYYWNDIYAEDVYTNDLYDRNTGYVNCHQDFRPSSTSYDLGSSTYYWSILYSNSVYTNNLYDRSGGVVYSQQHFYPGSSASYNLGSTSYYWQTIYAETLYLDSGKYINTTADDVRYYTDENHEFYVGATIKAIIDDNIYTAGNLLAGGTKPFLIPHPDGTDDKFLRYTAQESPEVILRHRGVGKTNAEGIVEINLPNHFTLVTDRAGLVTVNLTPIGDNHIYLTEEPNNEIIKVGSREPSVSFHYEVIAVRDGYLNAPVEFSKSDKSLSSKDSELANKLSKLRIKNNRSIMDRNTMIQKNIK